MIDQPRVSDVDRGVLVFCIWSVFGFVGIGFFLEGLERDLWSVSAVGVGAILLAFVGHILVNGVFGTGFSRGETALGMAAYGLFGLVFLLASLTGAMSTADRYAGLTLFGLLLVGFLAYLFTRHGLRGAFSRFHGRPAPGDGGAD